MSDAADRMPCADRPGDRGSRDVWGPEAVVGTLLREQGGVVSRHQLLSAGATASQVGALLRQRRLAAVHPGVYVHHTGPPTWHQRAWAAVLSVGDDGALWGPSALRAADGPGGRHDDRGHLHVAVPLQRHLVGAEGVRLHRTARLAERTLWNTGPPRMRYEEAAIDVAINARDELAAVAALAAACGTRRTTAERLADSLAARLRVSRRAFLAGVLRDVAEGTCSVLEHGFLTLVQRPHGLPIGERQVPATLTLGRAYRDVGLPGTWVELDGRLFHDSAEQRDRDLDRDLDAAVDGAPTIRLGYGQVFARPCHTAYRLGVLVRRVIPGRRAHPCAPSCRISG